MKACMQENNMMMWYKINYTRAYEIHDDTKIVKLVCSRPYVSLDFTPLIKSDTSMQKYV